ncbi:MAG: hypothetical protein IJT01_12950 [Selenomonadaceae bacterium]|nr:hypothetical protein [Selenomonadaceae bacterium]
MARFQKIMAAGALGVALLLPPRAEAAIPVIDSENILQQIKTYTETVQVVTNTAEQIKLQIKELTSLPQQILDTYKTAIANSMAVVTGAMKDSGFFLDDTHWNEYWQEIYPRLQAGEYRQTTWSERSINTTIQETLAMLNKKDVTNYLTLMQELEKSKTRLQELLELNKSPEGSKQAQQLANEIAAEKAHIESIQTAIQAMTAKNETMKRQADVLEKQNHQAVVQAAQQAEDAMLTKMREETTPSVTMIDDPWQTYGNVRW